MMRGGFCPAGKYDGLRPMHGATSQKHGLGVNRRVAESDGHHWDYKSLGESFLI
jgi:hypothetical protein